MHEVDERDLQIFIDGALYYFDQISNEHAEVRTPYLLKGDLAVDEYTGVIGINGVREGSIYFTAPRAMLRHILLALGENDTSDELYNDLVGEIANTISGNARRQLGSEFNISVPEIIRDRIIEILEKNDHPFAIPIRWKSYTSSLVIRMH